MEEQPTGFKQGDIVRFDYIGGRKTGRIDRMTWKPNLGHWCIYIHCEGRDLPAMTEERHNIKHKQTDDLFPGTTEEARLEARQRAHYEE